jgi:hypothetical protein
VILSYGRVHALRRVTRCSEHALKTKRLICSFGIIEAAACLQVCKTTAKQGIGCRLSFRGARFATWRCCRVILYRPARVNIRSPSHRAFTFVLSLSGIPVGLGSKGRVIWSYFFILRRGSQISRCPNAKHAQQRPPKVHATASIQEAKLPALLEDRKKAEFTIQLNPHWIQFPLKYV